MQAWLLGACALAAGSQSDGLQRVEELALAREVVLARLADLDGDGSDELVVFDAQGGVTRHRAQGGRWLVAAGEARLEDPAHALLDFAALEPDSAAVGLVVATPRGTFLWQADAAGFPAEPRRLSSRARMPYRTGAPLWGPIVQDVNRDGRPDLVLPVHDACELWLHERDADGALALRRSARVAVDVERDVETAGDKLSDVLESSISVPNLATRDVNGDGRPDLLVEDGPRRSFFLQDAAGGFPAQPDVALDLAIFRDTGFEGGIQPGRTLALEGQATYRSRDLDGDRIPDHVLAHGRKVWVFLGDEEGPQFTEPLSILKTAEDITAVTLARIDGDALADLVLFKVQLPTIATLLRGLFGEWDVVIGAVGYRNLEGRGFEQSPSSRSERVVRLPSIVGMLKNPSELLARFEELESRFRIAVHGDFDGDGARDLGLVSSDGAKLEVWIGSRGAGGAALDADRALREVFFEGSDAVWDLDRILLWLGGVADRQVALETGGRAASFALALRPEAEARLESLLAGDLDGDGRDELVAGYAAPDGADGARFDVLRIAPEEAR
jgi:hypothetical protein